MVYLAHSNINIIFIVIFIFRWLGEKYDGIRYCWNPIQSQVYHISFIVSFFSLFVSLVNSILLFLFISFHFLTFLKIFQDGDWIFNSSFNNFSFSEYIFRRRILVIIINCYLLLLMVLGLEEVNLHSRFHLWLALPNL